MRDAICIAGSSVTDTICVSETPRVKSRLLPADVK